MRRWQRTLLELINPKWGTHASVPPFEAGLRPNDLLDDATSLLASSEQLEPDDVLHLDDGTIVFTSGTDVNYLRDGQSGLLTALDGRAGALALLGGRLLVAVDGRGILEVLHSGSVEEFNVDPLIRRGVTDMCATPDGDLLITVGSTNGEAWKRALVEHDRTGLIVRVTGGVASIEAQGLAWPAGIALDDDQALISLSFEHRIVRRSLRDLAAPGSPMTILLPVYPGRIRASEDGWWVVGPYPRNRMTELILDGQDEFVNEMKTTIEPDQWLMPRLRSDNPITDTLQFGQLRVHAEVKPWAPPRSYGLIFHIDKQGSVDWSAHARVNSDRHGLTGIAAHRGELVVAAQGYRNLLALAARG
jgi:hypothetical protein